MSAEGVAARPKEFCHHCQGQGVVLLTRFSTWTKEVKRKNGCGRRSCDPGDAGPQRKSSKSINQPFPTYEPLYSGISSISGGPNVKTAPNAKKKHRAINTPGNGSIKTEHHLCICTVLHISHQSSVRPAMRFNKVFLATPLLAMLRTPNMGLRGKLVKTMD